jgi:hypothetical protein
MCIQGGLQSNGRAAVVLTGYLQAQRRVDVDALWNPCPSRARVTGGYLVAGLVIGVCRFGARVNSVRSGARS